jgi:hypothetical protein
VSAMLLMASACTREPIGPSPGWLSVEVAEVGLIEREVELSLKVTNTRSVPVYFEGCPNVPAVRVEALTDAGWQGAGSENLRCIAILTSRREMLKQVSPSKLAFEFWLGAYSGCMSCMEQRHHILTRRPESVTQFRLTRLRAPAAQAYAAG